ncbi:MAG TPA: methyltransferase domain-containing protein [Baekduia sp.]|nr:methyltransferase domain-containing protein [Baekduia sp.]
MLDATPAPARTRYRLTYPEVNATAEQDEECCDLHTEDGVERVRFHDYAGIYARPGLYEQLFYEELHCQSPQVVCDLLGSCLDAEGRDPADLRVLDLGAGNGMVGERLAELGAGHLVGVDLLDEARAAAERDRPGLYDDYVAGDVTALDDADVARLREARATCLTTVAALGFGDIPPAAFAAASEFVEDGGMVAITIKEDFLADGDGTGFARLVRDAVQTGTLEILEQRSYRHRLAADGAPLRYAAVVARKHGPLPAI